MASLAGVYRPEPFDPSREPGVSPNPFLTPGLMDHVELGLNALLAEMATKQLAEYKAFQPDGQGAVKSVNRAPPGTQGFHCRADPG